jgi:hypothetical protein
MPEGIEHVPTIQTRAKVEAFACAGFAQPMIAQYLGIGETTLVKHYPEELHNSRMNKIEGVAAHAFRRAMEGNDKMIELILRTQARWVNPKAPEDTAKSEAAGALMEKLIDKL